MKLYLNKSPDYEPGNAGLPVPISVCLLLAFCFTPAVFAQTPIYQNSDAGVDARVEDLLSRMTLDDKISQLVSVWDDKALFLDRDGRFDPDSMSKYFPYGVGHVARPSDRWGQGTPGVTATRGPRETAELVASMQRWTAENTRLGIPILFHEEGLHGYQANGATQFPQAIALAGTFDPGLVEDVYTVVAREIRARGAWQALTPVVDVGRDPRWGRIEETYGEDPYLVSEMGIAAVRGFQGNTMPLGPGRVMATLKHMTGHGQPESGTNIGPALVSERLLRDVFLPPFERAIREAGALSVMASYNEIDGIPSHSNPFLLTDILRDEWDFEGFVVSDYYAINDLVNRHHVASSLSDAARQAISAGVDVELPNANAFLTLKASVENNSVNEERIDQAVRRVLRAKFVTGLFDHPMPDPDSADTATDDSQAREVSIRAAREAVMLLKNAGGLLPLDLSVHNRIAVIGPNANEQLLGGYSDQPPYFVTVLDGIQEYVDGKARVEYAEGVRITEPGNWWGDEVKIADHQENMQRIQRAVAIARRSDVVILVLGGNEQTSREAWSESHLGDRTDLQLVGDQMELYRALRDTGVPQVVVMLHGRPLAIAEIASSAPAILDGWYLGQDTGTVIAEALFGAINPGGKLPVTLPRSVGQLPSYYNVKPTARRGYLFSTTDPLFPFGFGLSYTRFDIGDPVLDRSTISVGESVTVRVSVTNSGGRKGDEVVQIYVRDEEASVTRPIKELKAFRRITLEPGEHRSVSFELGDRAFWFTGRDYSRTIEPGIFTILAGPNSVDLKSVELTVKAQ